MSNTEQINHEEFQRDCQAWSESKSDNKRDHDASRYGCLLTVSQYKRQNCNVEVTGVGRTKKAAGHDARAKALSILRSEMPAPAPSVQTLSVPALVSTEEIDVKAPIHLQNVPYFPDVAKLLEMAAKKMPLDGMKPTPDKLRDDAEAWCERALNEPRRFAAAPDVYPTVVSTIQMYTTPDENAIFVVRWERSDKYDAFLCFGTSKTNAQKKAAELANRTIVKRATAARWNVDREPSNAG